MTSQDIKKQLKEPHFWNIVLTGQHADVYKRQVVKAIGNPNIKTAQVDADSVDELVALFNSFKPEIVINLGGFDVRVTDCRCV